MSAADILLATLYPRQPTAEEVLEQQWADIVKRSGYEGQPGGWADLITGRAGMPWTEACSHFGLSGDEADWKAFEAAAPHALGELRSRYIEILKSYHAIEQTLACLAKKSAG